MGEDDDNDGGGGGVVVVVVIRNLLCAMLHSSRMPTGFTNSIHLEMESASSSNNHVCVFVCVQRNAKGNEQKLHSVKAP